MCKQLVITQQYNTETTYVHYCQGSGPETFPVSRQHTSPLCVFMIEIETKHIHSCCQTLPSMPSLITIYMLSLF